MSSRLYLRLAAENIKKNGKTYIPYMLTCILTVAMFYIISSLSTNPGLSAMKRGGNTMPVVLNLGTVVVGIFAVIFLFYTNSFLMKRRKKEFGLYNILGMGKRHIAKVVALETLYTAVISIVIGLIAGVALDKLLYMVIAKILGESVPLGFYVSITAIISVFLLFGILFVLILLNSLGQIVLSNPIELLKGGNVGEKEPKTKRIMTILGVICLGAGYYMAVSVSDMAIAVGIFFIAVILVIIGTYMLFTAGSIFLLKALRKNKKYYYKPKHFISVSGMLYRMKQNAVGLANICILSTMVLVMISCTSALIIGTDDSIANNYPYDFTIVCYHPYDTNVENNKKAIEEIEGVFDKYSQSIEEKGNYDMLDISCIFDGSKITSQSYNIDLNKPYTLITLEVITAEQHNKFSGDRLSLEKGEVYLYLTGVEFNSSTINIFGKEYSVKDISVDENQYLMPTVTVFVGGMEDIDEIDAYFSADSGAEERINHVCRVFQYDITDESRTNEITNAFFDEIPWAVEESGGEFTVAITDRGSAKDDYVGLYGGLFFLGIFLGTLFVMAMILIIYYKQISEGYEDKNRFEIMQKVGMSKREVKSAIHSQVLTVFFLPLIMAGIHTAFAFNLVLKCMRILGFVNIPLYIACTVISFLAFAVAYVVIYLITARTYYKIVS